MEYCLGFTLQMVKLISSIDKTNFANSPKLLEDSVKLFPASNALHPVRHVHFPNVWDLVPSSNEKGRGKATNTTLLIAMKEFFKIPSATFQVMICCSNPSIVPDSYDWCKRCGFQEPLFNPLQVIVNALYAMMVVYWYLHAPCLTENQVVALQLLVGNAQGHLLVLDVVRKRLIEKNRPLPKKSKKNAVVGSAEELESGCSSSPSNSNGTSSSSTSSTSSNKDSCHGDVSIENIKLLMNPKFELLSHFPQSIRDVGCDNSVRDTELGELFMKLVRCIWNTTSKKYASVEYEMLKKYRNLLFLDVIKRGIQQRMGFDMFTQKRTDKTKAYMRDMILCETEFFSFACNCTSKIQSIVWNKCKLVFESTDGCCLNVHNILLDVSQYVTLE